MAFLKKKKERVVFTDIDGLFKPHGETKDVVLKTNEVAIKESLKNLIRTRLGERKFQPDVGCVVYSMLFENMTPFTAINIEKSIRAAINNYEPRVSLENVLVEENHINQGYDITISFYILNKAEEIKMDYFLERIR